MAKVYENDCVGCPTCGHCGRKRTPHYYCDSCKEEFDPDKLYDFDGDDVCAECLVKEFKTVKEREGF